MECSECSSSATNEDSEAAGAAPRKRSWIENAILKVITSPNLSISIPDPVPVAVVAVERYLAQSNAGSSSPTAHPAPSPTYCYDLTVSDGVYQDKWHLATSLNALVQRNILRSGIEVDITKCTYTYDEKRLGWGYVCIEELECGRDVPSIKTVPFRQSERAEDLEVPLRGGRKHYLPLWNNDDPYGDIWLQSQAPADQPTIYDSTVISLSELQRRWEDRRRSFPPVIVRILHKSRLRYFGKPNMKHDAPYQAYLEVADQSGRMSVVLWNSLCPKWYRSLKVGTVVLLENYVVKTSYPSRTLPTPRDPQMKRFDRIELGLNSRSPQANITIIPANHIKPEWKLPDVKYHFIKRSELNSLPHDHSCDVIGLVTFVGRAERLRQKDDGEDFWLYRWVHVDDGTSELPCVLELFATSQPEVFQRIHPMSYLVATQMRLVQSTSKDSSVTPYLTTSNESQIFITGLHQGQPYTSDKNVKRFIRWMRTQNEAELMEKAAIGGYYHFPPVSETFREYCKDSKAESILREFGELKKEIGQLHYRECRRIAVQGIIAAIHYVKDGKGAKHIFESEQIQDAECSSITSYLDESVGSPSLLSQIEPRWTQANSALRSLQSSSLHGHPSKKRKTQLDPKAQHSTHHDNWFVEESFDPEASSLQPDEPMKSGDREADGLGDRETDEDLWESELWSQMKNNLGEHLRYSPILPETVPRRFDYTHRAFLMKQYNLQPAKYVSEDYQSNKTIGEFSASNDLGQYIVTILDINHRTAIDVVYLPTLASDSTIYAEQAQDDTELTSGSVNLIRNQCMEGHFKGFPLPGEIVKSIHDLNRLHLVCILDICHLGGEHVEVCLNKVYNTAEDQDAPNQ